MAAVGTITPYREIYDVHCKKLFSGIVCYFYGNLKMIFLPIGKYPPVLQLAYNDGRVGVVFSGVFLNVLIGGFTCGS